MKGAFSYNNLFTILIVGAILAFIAVHIAPAQEGGSGERIAQTIDGVKMVQARDESGNLILVKPGHPSKESSIYKRLQSENRLPPGWDK